MPDTHVIAVLGTGIMGAPIARNLAAAGFEVRAWNRTGSKAEPLADDGVLITRSPRQAADGADFVVTMLANAGAVEASMTGDDGALAVMGRNVIWLQCSTVGVDGIERLASLAERAGVPFVDSPVLGSKKPAAEKKLTVLASGAAELEPRCRAVFEAIGEKVSWLGTVGAGSRLKLVMNSWVLAITAAVSEAVALSEGLGLDPRLFLDTLSSSPQMDTPYAHLKGEAMIARDFAASFPSAGAAKDMALIHDAARACGMADDVIAAVLAKFDRTVDGGYGDDDMAAVYLTTVKR